MLGGKRVIVVMPAYNAERTLERTFSEIPRDVVDGVILTDDASADATVEVARRLGITTLRHDVNAGYGANQKTCYRAALDAGADVVVMLHPDYQYSPRRIPGMAALVAHGVHDVVLGSRMRDGDAMRRGMPAYKFVGNRLLTALQNRCLGQSLTEYHTGYRAFSRRVLEAVPWQGFSDGFLFDNEMLVHALAAGFRIGEVACPARYDADSSSIGLRRSLEYGLGVLRLSWVHRRRQNRFR